MQYFGVEFIDLALVICSVQVSSLMVTPETPVKMVAGQQVHDSWEDAIPDVCHLRCFTFFIYTWTGYILCSYYFPFHHRLLLLQMASGR